MTQSPKSKKSRNLKKLKKGINPLGSLVLFFFVFEILWYMEVKNSLG